MTYQPGEPPSYTQPQDPWSPGVASPPTDPIPAPPARAYAPGVAAPVTPAPNVWSQETVVQGYDGRGSGGGGRGGIYALVVIIVLVLGGAGGVGAWYVIKERLGSPTPVASPSTSESAGPAPTFVPSAVKVGDCLFNRTPDSTPPTMVQVSCDTPGAVKVIKIQHGEGILHNADGKFDDATANSICLDVNGWDGSWFGWNSTNNALDYFFCLDNPAI